MAPDSTARLTGVAAVLIVADVVAAAGYYERCLGFAAQLWHSPPEFAMVRRDGLTLMLQQAHTANQVRPHWRELHGLWNVYFWVDDARALYAEFVAAGAHIDYGLGEKPYDVLEFGVQDLDGYDLAFGQVLQRAATSAAPPATGAFSNVQE